MQVNASRAKYIGSRRVRMEYQISSGILINASIDELETIGFWYAIMEESLKQTVKVVEKIMIPDKSTHFDGPDHSILLSTSEFVL